MPAATPLDRIIDAALEEAAAVGWTNISIDAVAARADVALGEVLMQAPTRAHLLLHFLRRLDARMLASIKGTDPADTPRDRLFDVLMRRFDLLEENREGVVAMMKGVACDPGPAAVLACRIGRSCATMLGAAGISADGVRGFMRIQGLKAVMAYAFRAWMNDDTGDMAKTMAAVDRALDRAQRFEGLSPLKRRGMRTAEAD
jgi:AcrR family transcriptional regulator